MTSVAVAVALYAIGESPYFGGKGGLAAFVFGLVLGHRRALAPPRPAPAGSRGLQEFHRELVFLLRTFFFIYLGMRVQITSITFTAVFGAIAFTTVFFASQWPSTAVLSRAWKLPALDSRILRAAVARGMTDTVLILYAISVGVRLRRSSCSARSGSRWRKRGRPYRPPNLHRSPMGLLISMERSRSSSRIRS